MASKGISAREAKEIVREEEHKIREESRLKGIDKKQTGGGTYADILRKGIEKNRINKRKGDRDMIGETTDREQGRREGEVCCCKYKIPNIEYFERKFGEQKQQLDRMETILIKIRETNKEIIKKIRSLKKILIKGFKLDVDSKEEKKKTDTNTQQESQLYREEESEEEGEDNLSFVNLNKYKSNNNKNKYKDKNNDNQNNIMEC